LNLQAKKLKLWRTRKDLPTAENITIYKKKFITEKKTKQLVIGNNKKNLGIFYKHINSRLTHKTGITPLCEPDGTIVIEDGHKANLLNSHFVSVGTIDDGIFLPFVVVARPKNASLSIIYFNTMDIVDIVSHLKVSLLRRPAPMVSQRFYLKVLFINYVTHYLFYFQLFFCLVIYLICGKLL